MNKRRKVDDAASSLSPLIKLFNEPEYQDITRCIFQFMSSPCMFHMCGTSKIFWGQCIKLWSENETFRARIDVEQHKLSKLLSPFFHNSLLIVKGFNIIAQIRDEKDYNRPIKHIYLRNVMHQDLFDQIPIEIQWNQLVTLNLPWNFNERLPSRMPPTLEILTFNDRMNASNISRFDQPFGMCLRNTSLKKLVLSNNFDQDISGDIFPPSLEYLHFGERFNQSVDSLIHCKKLRKVCFGRYFSKCISNLPDSIQSLRIGAKFKEAIVKPLPTKLLRFIFNSINYEFGDIIKYLPHETLLSLHIPRKGIPFSEPLDLSHFCALRVLNLGHVHHFKDVLYPPHLEILFCKLGGTCAKDNHFPSSLLDLRVSNELGVSVDMKELLPPSLRFLHLFSHRGPIQWLPPSLELLYFDSKLNHSLPPKIFPMTMKKICCPHDFEIPLHCYQNPRPMLTPISKSCIKEINIS